MNEIQPQLVPTWGLVFMSMISLIVIVVVVFVIANQKGRSPTVHRTRRHVGAPLALVGGLAVLGLLLMLGLVGVRSARMPVDVATRNAPQPLKVMSQKVEAGHIPLAEDPDQTSQPEWVTRGTRVIEEGVVSTVQLVQQSGEWSTAEEAKAEALQKAKRELLSRMAPQYLGIDQWDMPTELFVTASVQQHHVQEKLHDFGNFKDTMRVCYVQFNDSPHVRERIAEQWERFAVDRNVKRLGGIFGVVVIGLGAASVALRGGSRMIARREQQQSASV